MDYINTAIVVSIAQGVPKRPLENMQFTKSIQCLNMTKD